MAEQTFRNGINVGSPGREIVITEKGLDFSGDQVGYINIHSAKAT